MLAAPVVRRRLVTSRTCARVAAFFTPSGPAGGGAASSGDGGGVDCFGRGETPVGGVRELDQQMLLGCIGLNLFVGRVLGLGGSGPRQMPNSIAIS